MKVCHRLLVLLMIVVLCSCSHRAESPLGTTTDNESASLIPAGDLQSEGISFQFSIYYLPKPKKDPLAEIDQLLKDKFTIFKRIEDVKVGDESPVIAARIDNDPHKEYAPPHPDDVIERFGRGVTDEQAKALQNTEAVLIVDFAYSKVHVWDGLRAALALVSELARRTGGLIWDETTREVFASKAWDEHRINNWTERVPDVSRYIIIHSYQTGEFLRAITLGMEKIGLPDIVINNFPRSFGRNVGHVINLFAQALAEGAVVQRLGEFDLDFRKINHSGVRDAQVTNLTSNATAIAILTLREGTWEKGDPENRLIEITFERGIGPDIHAKRAQVLSAAFGSEDSVSTINHDEILLEASRRARTKLPALRADFNKGLAPGEVIHVKVPFLTPKGQQEWMWVEVTAWKGDRMTGVLDNDPFDIPTLRAGQIVEVSEAKVFDYIRRREDGTVEGNETGKVIEKRSRSAE